MALRRTPRDTSASPDLVRAVVDEVSWYMSQHKVSRADLAQSMGVSPGRVSQILSGDENLTLRTLSAAASRMCPGDRRGGRGLRREDPPGIGHQSLVAVAVGDREEALHVAPGI